MSKLNYQRPYFKTQNKIAESYITEKEETKIVITSYSIHYTKLYELIDIAKCADCDECVSACREENGWTGHDRPATDAQWIRKVSLRDRRSGFSYNFV